MTFIEGKREEETKTSALLSPLPPPSALDKRARPGFHRKTTKHAVSQHIKTNIGDSFPYYRGQTDTIRICTVYMGICGFCRGTITKKKSQGRIVLERESPVSQESPGFPIPLFSWRLGDVATHILWILLLERKRKFSEN